MYVKKNPPHICSQNCLPDCKEQNKFLESLSNWKTKKRKISDIPNLHFHYGYCASDCVIARLQGITQTSSTVNKSPLYSSTESLRLLRIKSWSNPLYAVESLFRFSQAFKLHYISEGQYVFTQPKKSPFRFLFPSIIKTRFERVSKQDFRLFLFNVHFRPFFLPYGEQGDFRLFIK